jgi:hypothetical protein
MVAAQMKKALIEKIANTNIAMTASCRARTTLFRLFLCG